MIKALYTAGKLLAQLDAYKAYFRPWANPFPKLRGEAKVIIAELIAGKLQPTLSVEDFDPALVDKYLFREAKSNATNLVPTFYLQPQPTAEKQVESIRTMVKKIRQSIKNYGHDFVTNEQIDAIEQMLRQMSFDITSKYLFTFRIDGRYFGDEARFRALFIEDKTPYSVYWRKSLATDKVCAVSYEQAPEVWGRVNTLGFTVEKPAFARNGFDGADSYKMFPVSPEVVKTLEGAKRLILDLLSRNFFGMKYFIMPRFLQAISDEEAADVWAEFLLKCGVAGFGERNLTDAFIEAESTFGAILDSETLSHRLIYYDIFFYEENQAQFAIKLHLADVLPTRLRQVMAAKTAIDTQYAALTDLIFVSKDVQEKFRITLSFIKDYFASKVKMQGKEKWVFHPYFFRVIEAIFYNQPLDREQLLRVFMDTIRLSFKNTAEQPYQFSRDVRHTFVMLQFFYQLKLLSFSNMEPTEPQPIGLMLDTFEQQHPDLLTHPLRRAAFYLGCEVEMLLAKQKSFYRNQPFRQQLNGLNLDVEQLRKIHLKLTAKIGEYADSEVGDKRHFSTAELNRISELDAYIGPALLLGDNTLSKADLSYAFAVGMALQKAFALSQGRIHKLNKATPVLAE
jgi:CRISPR-associated protein Cas8b/Csh1 subtype I-B